MLVSHFVENGNHVGKNENKMRLLLVNEKLFFKWELHSHTASGGAKKKICI
jgi:hypothetical protein